MKVLLATLTMFLLIGCKAELEPTPRSQVQIQNSGESDTPRELNFVLAPTETRILNEEEIPPVISGSLDEELIEEAVAVSTGGIITGAGQGGGPHLKTFENMNQILSVFPISNDFKGGIRVAGAQLTNDNVVDIVVAQGPTLNAQVRFIDGASGQLLRRNIVPYPEFEGGIFVATADLNNNAFDDIITGADQGGGPHVKVFSSLPADNDRVLLEFMAYETDFTGGVRVAAGDVNGDGQIEIITAPGPGRPPTVRVFNSSNGELLYEFNHNGNSTLGLFVATGDVDGNGDKEIILGLDQSQLPLVATYNLVGDADNRRFKLIGLNVLYDTEFSGGVRVAASDLNGDGKDEIIAGAGITGGPHIRAIEFATGKLIQDFFAYDPNFTGGVYVSGF